MSKRRFLVAMVLTLSATGCGQSVTSPTPAPTDTPIAVPTDPFTPGPMPSAPSAGETWTRPADGMVMVYVPAGEFLMGATDADSEAGEDEKPPHRVYLDGFWIDRTEVTNAQYRKCVEARACREPWCWDESNFGYHDRFNALDQPVVCVLWNNAHDYAAWVGGRLPTEAEWEKAARGTDGRKYPWGNEAPDCSKANYKDCVGGTTAVGSCPEGASPYGALDMAGNAWEWTTDKYGEDYYTHSPSHNPQGPDSGGFRVMRGGAFLGDPRNIRCTARYRGSPKYRPWWYGFRVVVPYTAPGP